jgi:hypothetical protein
VPGAQSEHVQVVSGELAARFESRGESDPCKLRRKAGEECTLDLGGRLKGPSLMVVTFFQTRAPNASLLHPFMLSKS